MKNKLKTIWAWVVLIMIIIMAYQRGIIDGRKEYKAALEDYRTSYSRVVESFDELTEKYVSYVNFCREHHKDFVMQKYN